MLNPFPDLLTYSLYAPTLLRLAAAAAFAYIAWSQWQRRDAIAAARYPVIGSGAWISWASILIVAADALGLLVGYETQWAALVGAVIALKSAVWGRRYPLLLPLSLAASLLLFALCLSLLLSGAGVRAFDVRL